MSNRVNDTIETLVIDRSLDHSFIKDMSPINSERKFIHIQNNETMIKPVTLQVTPTNFTGQIGIPLKEPGYKTPRQKMLGVKY